MSIELKLNLNAEQYHAALAKVIAETNAVGVAMGTEYFQKKQDF